jgi:hypothetical protein
MSFYNFGGGLSPASEYGPVKQSAGTSIAPLGGKWNVILYGLLVVGGIFAV